MMAQNKSLNYLASTGGSAHFCFFDLDIQKSTLQIVDSLSSSFADSQYFDESSVKLYFNYILRIMTYSKDSEFSAKRTLRKVVYKKTKFTQIYLECGVISSLNLIFSLSHTIEFLTTYTIREYDLSLSNFKQLVQVVLSDGVIPQNKIVVS